MNLENAPLKGGAVRGDALARSAGKPFIVAVDGPAGSGKSSICAKVAERIGWTYINTGAIYRAVGLIAVRSGVDLSDEVALADMVERIAGDLRWNEKDMTLWHGAVNLTPDLQSESAGHGASKVAKLDLVRQRLLPVQKALTLAAAVGALVDGRDIGTVVFPDADLKIFLTASLEERSRRRLAQLGNTDHVVPPELEDVMRAVARRDERDTGRAAAPLKRADDATMVDTSSMGVEDTIATIIELMRAKGLVP